MRLFISRLVMAGLLLAVILTTAGRFGMVAAQETDDPVKIDIYKKFYDNRLPNPAVAYQAAKDYIQRYSKDQDEYTKYLRQWMMFYERDDRKKSLPILINDKKFSEAYRVGNQILADEPGYLRAEIDLGYAGYLASSAKDETYNSQALAYARKAVQAIESGKAPSEWAPFKGKDDTLAYLNYAIGYLTLKTNPADAIDPLLKSAQYESDIKKTPSTYYFLAVAYESGPYKALSTAYQSEFANKPETPASKAALEKLNVLMDRIIDAYARAIAAAGTDPKTQQSRAQWTSSVTGYWKFRHADSEAGLPEFIAGALSKPLPPKP